MYRFCIEKGLLRPDQIAQTTFYRFIREYDLLDPEDKDNNKKRLAFSMKYANQLWQADTMFGPFLDTGMPGAARKQAKLIASLPDILFTTPFQTVTTRQKKAKFRCRHATACCIHR